LLDGHGVLEFGRKGPPGKSEISAATLHFRDAKGRVTLSISGNAIFESLVRYFEFADSYIVGYLAPEGPPSAWPKGAVHRVYLLTPQGRISEHPIPGGPWNQRRLSTILLTQAGLVFYGGEIRRYLNPGTAGIYLTDGKRVVKMASGLLHGIGVSPSGCKVAAAMRSYERTPDPTTIRVFNVCSNGSRR
jgi:hypothetical protein